MFAFSYVKCAWSNKSYNTIQRKKEELNSISNYKQLKDDQYYFKEKEECSFSSCLPFSQLSGMRINILEKVKQRQS